MPSVITKYNSNQRPKKGSVIKLDRVMMIALISIAKRKVIFKSRVGGSRCSKLKLTDAREVNETITCFKYIQTEPNLTTLFPPHLQQSGQLLCHFFFPFFFYPSSLIKNFSRPHCPLYTAID